MAINFNFSQFKKFTRELIQLEENLNDSANAVESITNNRQDLLEEDERNEIFFNRALEAIDNYHREKELIDNSKRSVYNPVNLTNSATDTHLGPIHFPISPIWKSVTPKLIDSINGLPTLPDGEEDSENYLEFGFSQFLSIMISGWSGTGQSGAVNVSSTQISRSSNQSWFDSFTVGQSFLLIGGSQFLTIGKVLSKTLGSATAPIAPSTVTVEIVAGDELSEYTSGGDVFASLSGFGENVRKGLTTKPNTLLALQSAIMKYIARYNVVADEIIDLNFNNPITGIFRTQNASNRQSLTNFRANLTIYSNLPENVADENIPSRYDNAGISTLSNILTTRGNYKTNTRVPQLNAALSQVTQNNEGVYQGEGAYYNLMKWIDARISLSQGSLSGYLGSAIAQQAVEASNKLLNDKANEYNDLYIYTKIVENTSLNSIQFFVENASLFQVGNVVSILDDDSTSLYNRTIVEIDSINNVITVSSPVPQALNSKQKFARMVRPR